MELKATMNLRVIVIEVCIRLLVGFFVAHLAQDKYRAFGLWFIFGAANPTWALFYVMLVDDLRHKRHFPLSPRKIRLGRNSQLEPFSFD